jgi:hypothetical protein
MNKPQKPEKPISPEEALNTIERVATQVGLTVGEFKRKECSILRKLIMEVKK